MRRSALAGIAAAAVLLAGSLPAPCLAGDLLSPARSTEAGSGKAGSGEVEDGFAPRIVNGLSTFGHPAVGVLLLGNDPDTASLACSGTLIGCNTFLTAAHCVCRRDTGAECQGGSAPNPSSFGVYLQHAGFFQIADISVHPDYLADDLALGRFPEADLAVISLTSPVHGIAPERIAASESPAFGTRAEITGFGRTGVGEAIGVKRSGEVVTAPCPIGMSDESSVCWVFDAPIGPVGEDSNTCNGDSGGPLFVDYGAGDELAGVTSGGLEADCLADDHSWDTDVFFHHQWITTEAGVDLGPASCGPLPPVGGSGAHVFEFDGRLRPGDLEFREAVTLAGENALLRVTMNGAGGSDFDLFVRHGAPPTQGDFDCARTGRGQYGHCAFSDPASGDWHLLVQRVSGTGRFQLSATVFEHRVQPQASPEALAFGIVPLGTQTSLPVELSNGGAGSVVVESIVPVGCSAFDVSHPSLPFSLAPGGFEAIDVSFAPPVNHPFACRLEVSTTPARKPPLVIGISGDADASGTGARCAVQLAQSSYDRTEPLTAASVKLANPSALPARVGIEFRVHALPPTGPEVAFWRNSFVLPGGFDFTSGRLELLPGHPLMPSGLHEVVCRVEDPATGAVISEDRAPFTIR